MRDQALLKDPSSTRHVLLVSSVHDYRMSRRGSFQFIADGLAEQGCRITFISVRFSMFSLLKRDSRSSLWSRANNVEIINSIRAYLYRTWLHPFCLTLPVSGYSFNFMYKGYARAFCKRLKSELESANIIIVESGLGASLIKGIRSVNRGAVIIYRASDILATVGAPPVLQTYLQNSDTYIDYYCLLAPRMRSSFSWSTKPIYVVGQAGSLCSRTGRAKPKTFAHRKNAVSMGPTLFDRSFFTIAAYLFPHVTFHVIGCGERFPAPENVIQYPEVNHYEILSFLEHADLGIAAYKVAPKADYLSESSLKLKQFAALNIPAVCPYFALNYTDYQFGYTPGDVDSIKSAISDALVGRPLRLKVSYNPDEDNPKWAIIAQHLICPELIPKDKALRLPDRPAVASPRFSLILCTVGRTEELRRLLVSLTKQTLTDFEVVIVDQNTTGLLYNVLSEFRCKLQVVHLQCERGLSKARNHGIASSSGTILAFPDDDCWYSAQLLSQVTEEFEIKHWVDILCVKTVDETGLSSVSPFRDKDGIVDRYNVWSSGNSNGMFVRREALRIAGGFNEKLGVGANSLFQSGEETELIIRALLLGKNVQYTSRIQVFHDQVQGSKNLRSRSRSYALGFGYVLAMHRYGYLYLSYRLARSCARIAKNIVTLKWDDASIAYEWLLGTAQGYFIRVRCLRLYQVGRPSSRGL